MNQVSVQEASGPGTPDPPALSDRGGTRLRTGLAWSYVFATGGTAVSALLQVAVTAILTPRAFGVMVLAMVWVSLALVLLQHGPTLAVIQHEDMTDEHANAAFWLTLAGASVFTIVFCALTPLWAAANHLPELIPVSLALAPVVILSSLVAIPDAIIRRRMQMRSIALRGLASALISGLAGVAAALAGWGVWSLVTQQLVTYTVYVVLLYRVTPWKPRRPRLRPILAAWRDLRSSSLQTLSGSLGHFLSTKIDGMFMGLFFTPAVIGIYRFATRFPDMVGDLTSGGLEQVSLAELARHNADRARLAQRLDSMMHLAALLAFPALSILAASARAFTALLGPQWTPAVTPLRVMCAVSAVAAISNLLGPALQAADRPGVPAAFTWLGAVVYIGGFLTAVGLTRHDSGVHRLVMVAFALLALQLMVTGLLGYVAYRRILRAPLRGPLLALLPGLLAGGVAFAAGVATEQLTAGWPPILALALSGCCAVGAAGLLLLAIDAQVRDWARAALRRIRPARDRSAAGTPATAPDVAPGTPPQQATGASAELATAVPGAGRTTVPVQQAGRHRQDVS